MQKLTIIFVALFSSLFGLRAQEKSESAPIEAANSIGFSWGLGNLKKQDLIFTPFVHQSWSALNFVVDYERSGKLEQRATVRFGNYKANTGDYFSYQHNGETYSKYGSSFNQVDLNYSLGVKLIEKKKWTFILGGRFRNRFQISDYDFGTAAPFAYHVPIGLDAWFNLSFDPGSRHRFEANLNLPLFSYVARSPYMGQDDQYLEEISVHGDLKVFFAHLKSGEVQSWGSSQIVDLDLRYHFALSDRWDLDAGYLFSMNLNSTPLNLTSYENLFLIGATFKF